MTRAHRFDNSGVDLAVQPIDLFGVSGKAEIPLWVTTARNSCPPDPRNQDIRMVT